MIPVLLLLFDLTLTESELSALNTELSDGSVLVEALGVISATSAIFVLLL